jgi:RNA polymerase sigma factor (TIGR02999 family)
MMGEEPLPAPGPEDDVRWKRAYDVLRRLAALYMRGEHKGHTLDPTALVNEAFVRLASAGATLPREEAEFIALASHKMRQVLVDHARRNKSKKRGENWARVTLDEGVLLAPRKDIDIIDLDDAMAGLGTRYPRAAQVVELRFFMGLTEAEAAGVLDVSRQVVEREWMFGKTWLARELRRGEA